MNLIDLDSALKLSNKDTINLYKKHILDNICNLINPIILEYQKTINLQKISSNNKLFVKELVRKHISDYLYAKDYWERYYSNSKNKNMDIKFKMSRFLRFTEIFRNF